jgi:RNA polymerase sigma factor (sigma-70 family)
MDSELEKGPVPVPEEGEKRLHELTSEFLRSRDPHSPDPQVVGRLYIATFQHLVRHFERRANDQRLAEDATQEGFKELQSHFEKHKTLPDQPMAFLLTVSRNWLRNRARDESRRTAVSLEHVPSATLDAVLDPSTAARQPFEAVASTEIKEVAYAALDQLDVTTRKIIELHREGKPWDEIALAVRLPNADAARNKFDHAVHHVKDALGAHFSSCVTTAEQEVRRWINTRRAGEQAIDLLPTPYNKVLCLLLVEKRTEKEIAAQLGVSPGEVQRHHERAVELFTTKYHMTEDELLDVLWHGHGR